MSKKENKPVDEVTKADAPEAEAEETAEAEVNQEHVELTGMLEDARNKADEHWNQILRLQAELENLQKRSERELANAHKFALDRFSQDLLPVRDSLEMGLSAFTESNADTEKLREGVDLTLQMLVGVMEKFGISEVNPQDEPFNPDLHQAMSMQDREDVAPNTVVTVVQKGYLLHDRLIRPALVIVSSAAQAQERT
ncbi:MAG: nucleotide exchange factor GrpE [Gammaproteobacteria bacterium]|nr:MAG: nucleotide exchange factor GrpE [Gammaproteobacteria bacterium]